MKRFFSLLLAVTIIDQAVKLLIVRGMALGESIEVIPNFFHLTYLHNYGAAFSTMEGWRPVFLIMTPIVLIALVVFLKKSKNLNPWYYWTLGLFAGGAVGNFIDRVFLGYVIDYLEFIFGSYHFAVFNFADSCLVVGAILTSAILLLEDYIKPRKKVKSNV